MLINGSSSACVHENSSLLHLRKSITLVEKVVSADHFGKRAHNVIRFREDSVVLVESYHLITPLCLILGHHFGELVNSNNL